MKLKFSSGCWRVLSLVIFSHTFMPASSYVHRFGPTIFNVLSSLFYPGYFELIWLVSDLVIFGHTFSIRFFCPAVAVLGSTFWCGGMCWDLKGDGKARLSSLDIPERPLDKPQLTTTQSTATGVIWHPFQKATWGNIITPELEGNVSSLESDLRKNVKTHKRPKASLSLWWRRLKNR